MLGRASNEKVSGHFTTRQTFYNTVETVVEIEREMNDFEIIQSVLGGDREAYAELVRRYHARIRSHCLTLLLEPAEADDAAQDVFLKALTSLPAYKRDSSFFAWLYRIASNHCLDVLRKRKRQRTDSLDRLTEGSGDAPGMEFLTDSRPSEPPLERAENLRTALDALALISPEHRQVLMLREVDGLSYEEIREALHCSLDTVKTRLHRGRRQLQEKARHLFNQRSLLK
ncbi:MAG TPA: RNA polymerase sigma factor [Elusimicrobiota bacterium]|nr:RNA polymerase sigma factor [Elusimicrobiota bacterium]